jgi:hypothetical protein
MPGAEALNFVSGCGVPIARRDFLQAVVGETLETEFWLGRVFVADRERGEWVTFRGKRPLIVRGSKNVSFRVCELCARNVYFAMGSRYLCPPPPPDISAFETDLFGIAVRVPTVAIERTWSGVSLEPLPIREHAADGLPDTLSWRSPAE